MTESGKTVDRKNPLMSLSCMGLDKDFKEEDMIEALQKDGTDFLDLRIVRHRTGISRGFGFLEFKSVSDARAWMELHKCGGQNFSSKRRMTCFKCGAAKETVLILKGLDTITNVEAIRKALVEITALPIYDVRLIRDKLTNTSRGFCFVELGSVEEASQLLEIITNMHPSFAIEHRIVTSSYAKHDNPPKQTSATAATAAIEQAQWSQTATTTKPSSAVAANAMAQAQAAGSMGTVTAESYATQKQTYDATNHSLNHR
ncbi:RNA-binding protein 5 [Desmophyllum pertusum]|uniref:RNA-binding protein 5 n=1 Tax=Desmophyllum pertusum TaxID=174260 RepID=A0A9W9Z093_9CNID|nr:RNA-binding protein 5 [Desmophyllum pertusum]